MKSGRKSNKCRVYTSEALKENEIANAEPIDDHISCEVSDEKVSKMPGKAPKIILENTLLDDITPDQRCFLKKKTIYTQVKITSKLHKAHYTKISSTIKHSHTHTHTHTHTHARTHQKTLYGKNGHTLQAVAPNDERLLGLEWL